MVACSTRRLKPLSPANQTIKNHIVLTVVILLQILVLLVTCIDKVEYSIDEVYSYILSNSYHYDRISNDDSLWDHWVQGNQFDDFVTVQNGERFAFDKVYYNNSTDAHPPLYYWILHSVCSLFPEQFSKWQGLIINLMLFVFVDLLLYFLSRKLITSQWLQFLPMIIYGFSPIAIDTVTFIRMYSLLTFFSVAFCYLTVSMMNDGITGLKLGLTWFVIYLGAMTHYYSLVVCFWGVLFFDMYLLKRKDFRLFAIHSCGSLISVALVYVSYPYILSQAFGSDTNNIGQEVTKDLFNIQLHLQKTLSLTKSLARHIGYSFLGYGASFLIVCTIIILIVLNVKKHRMAGLKFSSASYWIFSVFVAAFISISFIGGEYVELRYIYHIVPLMFILAVYLFEELTAEQIHLRRILAALCVLFAVGNCVIGTVRKSSTYLYIDIAKENEILEEYKDYQLIIIGNEHNRNTAVPTGNFTKIRLFNTVYLSTLDNIRNNDVFRKCLDTGDQFIVYFGTSHIWLDGLDPTDTINILVNDTTKVSWAKLTDGSLGEYYLIEKDADQ